MREPGQDRPCASCWGSGCGGCREGMQSGWQHDLEDAMRTCSGMRASTDLLQPVAEQRSGRGTVDADEQTNGREGETSATAQRGAHT